jgi:hypothetical protein
MPILKCHDTVFYSQIDEEMFFTALKKISGVKRIEFGRTDLLVTVQSRISDKALRELLGLFLRYKVDMRQLARFLTQKNRSWFHDPKSYWYRKVFSKP